MKKILIVEDDMIIAADISMQLARMGYEVTGILPRGEDALKNIENTLPDIILMDIHLKGKMDGIETAQLILEQYQIPVIFLTANADDTSFQRAKATKPYAFISKPFKRLDLSRAIELVASRLSEETKKDIQVLEGEERDTDAPFVLDDRIFIRYNNRMIKLLLSDIQFVAAERNYCTINTTKKNYLISVPLKYLYETIATKEFIRVHRSYLINLLKIDELGENYDYVRIGKIIIPISRSYKKDLINKVKRI